MKTYSRIFGIFRENDGIVKKIGKSISNGKNFKKKLWYEKKGFNKNQGHEMNGNEKNRKAREKKKWIRITENRKFLKKTKFQRFQARHFSFSVERFTFVAILKESGKLQNIPKNYEKLQKIVAERKSLWKIPRNRIIFWMKIISYILQGNIEQSNFKLIAVEKFMYPAFEKMRRLDMKNLNPWISKIFW